MNSLFANARLLDSMVEALGFERVRKVTWDTKPAANAVPAGTRIRVTDVGISPGVRMVSDGSNWRPDGPQLLARSGVSASVSGTTTETALATVSIPAGLLGLNGGLHIHSSWTAVSSANSKTMRIRFGGMSGTQYYLVSVSAIASLSDFRRIRNRNSASSQIGSTGAASQPYNAGSASALVTSSVDTSVATTLVLTGALGANAVAASETLSLDNYEVWVTP